MRCPVAVVAALILVTTVPAAHPTAPALLQRERPQGRATRPQNPQPRVAPVQPVQDDGPDDLFRAARSSPLFQAELGTSELARHQIETITLRPGIDLDVRRYLEGSRLTTRPDVRPLFGATVQRQFLARPPAEAERILKLQDRLVVDRTLTVVLKPGACRSATLPSAVADLCFRPKKGLVSAGVRADLEIMRQKLRGAPPTRVVEGGVSAADALRMSDDELIDLVFNQGEREIRHTSVIPLQVHSLTAGTDLRALELGPLDDFRVQLKPLAVAASVSSAPRATAGMVATVAIDPPERIWDAMPEEAKFEFGLCMIEVSQGFDAGGPKGPEWGNEWDRLMVKGAIEGTFFAGEAKRWEEARPLLLRIRGGQRVCTERNFARIERDRVRRREAMEARPRSFPEKYFLTGDTVARRIQDKFEVTFARATWFTDRYYARFSYYVDVSYGLRLPFALKVEAERMVVAPPGGERATRSRRVTVAARAVNADDRGNPVYSAVNLERNEYLGGKEFVFSVGAGCKFKASIPGPNIDPPWIEKRLPKFEGDFEPKLGSGRTPRVNMENVWADGEKTGLAIGGGIGGAYLDVGLAADMTTGTISYRVRADGNTQLRGGSNRRVSVTGTAPQEFFLSPQNIDQSVGITIDEPRYAFTVAIIPQVKARLNLDLGIYEWTKTFGPYRFDGLAIRADFDLGGHPGTRTLAAFAM